MNWSRQTALIIFAGVVFGVLAAMMTKWHNPPNMGICAACFLRDIAGALGLHRVATVQYIRLEIIGFVLGAFAAALVFREFRARGGSSPLLRFVLGAFIMIGALVFLGCPVRALLRLANGDMNGITALGGLVVGAVVGIFFLKRGFNLGRSNKTYAFAGLVMPILMVGLLLLAVYKPSFIFKSATGPGSMHVGLAVALVVGLAVGLLAQRSRLCFVGGWRDLFLIKDTYLLSGIAAFFIAAFITNVALGHGHIYWGFVGQPIAHDNHLWNFLGMALVGLGATLVGGCPLRQLILSGEGDGDAGMTVLGMVTGAAVAQNFFLASSAKGISAHYWGAIAVIVGLVFCLGVGLFMRDKA